MYDLSQLVLELLVYLQTVIVDDLRLLGGLSKVMI